MDKFYQEISFFSISRVCFLLNHLVFKGLDMQKIKFYMDFLSPFTYFAWVNHHQLKDKYNAQFEYLPITMGTLFNHHEITGPGLIPAKRLYSLKHCFRYAKLNKIDFIPPHSHPFNPLYVLRMATQQASGELQEQVIDTIWKLIWAKGEVLEDPNLIIQKFNELGIDANEILEKTYEREVKQAVKKNTKEAIAHHAFGSPSFLINDELFWGNDSLELIESYLDEEGDSFDVELFKQRTSDIILK